MSSRNAAWIWMVAILATSVPGAAIAECSDPVELPPDVIQALHSDGKATLYSLDPGKNGVDVATTFDHWAVIGKADLDSDQKKVAVRSFDQAIAMSNQSLSLCFSPRHALRIKWRGHVYDYLVCYSCRGLEVDRDGKRLAFAGISSGSPLELNALMTTLKLPLAQSSQDWLAKHASEQASAAAFRKSKLGWISASPASLRAFMDVEPDHDSGDLLTECHLQRMSASFQADIPDAKERVRQLLVWYGSSKGAWGMDSPYEMTAEALLADYRTSLVADVVAAHTSGSDALLEGAARYFAGHQFWQSHRGDLDHLSPATKALLLYHVLHSGNPQDSERRRIAMLAFHPITRR